MSRDLADVRAVVARTRAEQGLASSVDDDSTIDRVADVLRAAAAGDQATGTAA